MNQKKLIVGILVAIVLAVAGVFGWKEKNTSQPKQVTQSVEQSAKTDGIESVKDLIDGEYSFTPVDTSDWKIYKNEEVGFEIKIPKDWKLVNTFKDDGIKGTYFYFGQEGTTYSIPEGGTSDAAILVLISDRHNKKAMPLRDFLQKRKAGYGERISSLIVDQAEAVMVGETSARFFEGENAWVISFQPYYDRNNNIHVNEHDVFLGLIRAFKFLN